MTPEQRQNRQQLLIGALVVAILIIIGFLWAVFGNASEVTPIATATATVIEATPATPIG